MKILTILGSVRQGNNTAKVLSIVHDELGKYNEVEVLKIDPAQYELNLPGLPKNKNDIERMNNLIAEADGIVLSTPEYNGSYSSTIKLVIDNLSYPGTFKSKPLVLLGVADGKIGAIKALEHLRSVASHLGALVLPKSVSVANVNEVFDEAGNCVVPDIEKRIRTLTQTLCDFVKKIK